MKKTDTAARIARLRAEMRRAGIDYYLVTTADSHHSEYVAPHFEARAYLCGFDGSNGSLVIGADFAGLWTDGRYWIQAERQLAGSGVSLYRMGEQGVPTIPQLLAARMENGQRLGFDGRCVTAAESDELAAALAKKGKHVALVSENDLVGAIWTERPALPCRPLFVLGEQYAGRSFADKLADLRAALQERGASYYVSGRLDELMWLTNLRGGDIECNPVALSYGFFSMTEAMLFVQPQAVTDEVRAYAQESGLMLRPYGEFADFLGQYKYQGAVLLDPAQFGCALREKIRKNMEKSCKAEKTAADKMAQFGGASRELNFSVVQNEPHTHIIEADSPLSLPKAVKNETELRQMREVYREDSAAVCRFLYWLMRRMRENPDGMTEATAAAYLDGLRAQIEDFIELSFPTISAYGANAAMMHYEARPESCAALRPEGMLLVDSGGQYLRGTTDVTRTAALGPVTEAMRRDYTLTAAGNLALLNAVFMAGCTGRNLDILCREPLWRAGRDYKCGTGHGIGFVLNVHEGPQSIRWRASNNRSADETAFAPGMIVSDEPGVYLAGEYGIRLETILVCEERMETGDGTFYGFAPLTFVPFDRALLAPELLNGTERAWLDAYHARVYEEIASLLNDEERAWLRAQTEPFE